MEMVALAKMCTRPGQLKRQKFDDLVKVFGARMDGGGTFRVERKAPKSEFVEIFKFLVDRVCGKGIAHKLLTEQISDYYPFTDDIIDLLNDYNNEVKETKILCREPAYSKAVNKFLNQCEERSNSTGGRKLRRKKCQTFCAKCFQAIWH